MADMNTARVRATRGLAWLSLLGNGIFVVVAIGLPYAQRGYRIDRDAVSVLALGRYGWVQTIAFCALGVGTIALAALILRSTNARVAAVALGVAGALNFVAAAVHTVRVGQHQTAASIVHNVGGIVTFLLTVIAMGLLVPVFRRSAAAWAPMASPTGVWMIVAVLAMVATAPLANHFGIAERVLLATLISWMITCAAFVLTRST